MMKKIALVTLVIASLAASPAVAQCPCVPIGEQWVVETCEGWNCAASALILANGNSQVFTMPTANQDFPWVVLRRVTGGNYIQVPEPQMSIEQFDGMPAASSRFSAIDASLNPLLVTAPDGRILVLARKTPEARLRTVRR